MRPSPRTRRRVREHNRRKRKRTAWFRRAGFRLFAALLGRLA